MSKDSRIIGVEPTVPMISLTWMIGSRCNYDCMYCPQELHDATSAHSSLEKLKQAWHNFYNKTQHLNLPYKISFTGGEVTANKSFLPLIEYIRNGDFDIGQLLVTTNGSASLNYYRRLCDLVDAVSFSTHSEFFDEADFFSKVEQLDKIMVRPLKSLHVNIMDEFWNQDRIQLYQKWLQKRQISYSINSINYGRQTRTQILAQGKQNLDTV
jgi:MoaA/NifB/PqqE/SkfB family radical SAM enzyme